MGSDVWPIREKWIGTMSALKTVIFLLALTLTTSCSVKGYVKLSDFDHAKGSLPSRITLVNWNVEKGKDSDFRKDLLKIIEHDKPDIIFMQETSVSLLKDVAMAGYFASSWKLPWPGREATGVITLSKVAPVEVRPVPSKYREFFVISRKVSLATEYSLPGGEKLLSVNTHLLNFERWGTMKFRSQLNGLKAVMADHTGPIIMAGDFNTWNKKRLGLVQKLAEDLELKEVTSFPLGRKTGAMKCSLLNWLCGIQKDIPLDHVYYRGFTINQSPLLSYESSDHTAMLVELILGDKLTQGTD
jgi:endonuclease/exonuclease/phosphatase (EEP) superfamily protein YafD